MATLEITKAKSKTPKGQWFTFMVAEISIFRGEVYLLPVSEKYKWIKLMLKDCIILK